MPHVTLSSVEGRLDIQTDWADKELVKECPGTYWDTKRKTWHSPRTVAALLQLRNIFGERMTYSDEVEAWVKPLKEKQDYARYLARQIESETQVEGLYPWQVVDYQWAWTIIGGEEGGGALLGNDQGTGKTVSASVILANLEDALPALVICPNSVKRVWRDEIPKWIPDANVYIIQGTAAKRKALIAEALADPQSVMVINYEGVRGHSRLAPYGSTRLKRCGDCGGPKPEYANRYVTDDTGRVIEVDGVMQVESYMINEGEVVKPNQCHVHKRELNDTGTLRTVILDEAQALADPTSQQTRACWAVCHDPSVTRRLATTGTPIANSIADLYGIMHAVQQDEYPVRSAFINRYAQQEWNAFGGMDISGIRADNAPEFFATLDPRYRRVTKDQAAPWLPEKYRSQRLSKLPPKMRKAYKEMDEKLITRLDDGTILFSASELVQSTRLLQLSSSYGHVETLEDGTEKYILTDNPSPKIDELLQVLTERGPERPLACYAVSKQLLNLASARLKEQGILHGMIHGDVSDADRTKALDDFQAGHLACLLFNDAGGQGLTMTASDTILRLQRSWSILRNLQVEDRVHRIGSEIHERIHVIDVVAEDTVEEWQLLKLVSKLEQLEQLRRDGVDPMSWIAATGDDLRTCVYESEAA